MGKININKDKRLTPYQRKKLAALNRRIERVTTHAISDNQNAAHCAQLYGSSRCLNCGDDMPLTDQHSWCARCTAAFNEKLHNAKRSERNEALKRWRAARAARTQAQVERLYNDWLRNKPK